MKLLLKVGADPRAIDDEGETPLHLVAAYDPVDPALITTLLDGGAHIDSSNYEGATMESILNNRLPASSYNPVKYKTLACLAANVLVTHTKRQYYENQIPKSLVNFVADH